MGRKGSGEKVAGVGGAGGRRGGGGGLARGRAPGSAPRPRRPGHPAAAPLRALVPLPGCLRAPSLLSFTYQQQLC